MSDCLFPHPLYAFAMGSPRYLSANSLSVIGLTLFILAGVITLFSLEVRTDLRNQIIEADAALLYPVAITQLAHTLQDFGRNDDPAFLEANLLSAALSTVDLPGVLALRVYRQDGSIFDEVPIGYDAHPPAPDVWAKLRTLNPVSYFQPEGSLDTYVNPDFPYQPTAPRPLLVIAVPLHERNAATALGFAEFILDGSSVLHRLDALDRRLFRQAVGLFLIGGSVVTIALIFAFRKLHRANQLLADRSQSLLSANHELLMRAKLNAVGAIAAHLIHGIKNPLSGLQSYLAISKDPSQTADETADALATASRAQALVSEIVSILREEESGDRFTFSTEELTKIATEKVAPLAQKKAVAIAIENTSTDTEIDSRSGNLTLLILHNLLQNAVEATPQKGTVTLRIMHMDTQLCMEVADTGSGLPEHIQAAPFAPHQSTKPDGGGIGLAICSQLAQAMQANLILVSTDSQGTVFRLMLPS